MKKKGYRVSGIIDDVRNAATEAALKNALASNNTTYVSTGNELIDSTTKQITDTMATEKNGTATTSSDNIIETLTPTTTILTNEYTQPTVTPVADPTDTTTPAVTTTATTTTVTVNNKWLYYAGAAVAFYALYRILK